MFWLRDHSTKPEEDFQPPTASRVTVLAYSVRHAAFGGQFGGVSAMGELLYEEYLLPFLDIEVSEISTARSRFFGAGLEIPPVFDDPALWTDFDDGYPFLFGSITDRAGGQFSRLVIDAFESDGPEISTHGADVTWDPGVSVSEVDPKLAGVTGESDTKALAIAAPAESQISWTIAPRATERHCGVGFVCDCAALGAFYGQRELRGTGARSSANLHEPDRRDEFVAVAVAQRLRGFASERCIRGPQWMPGLRTTSVERPNPACGLLCGVRLAAR
jgi:hypothetical protein